MRIRDLVGMNVMHTVHRYPTGWSIFHAADTDDCNNVLHPLRRLETAVGQQSVVADRDSLAKDVNAHEQEHDASPTEKVGQQCHESKQVDHDDRDRVSPIQSKWNYRGWNWVTHTVSKAFCKFWQVPKRPASWTDCPMSWKIWKETNCVSQPPTLASWTAALFANKA